MKPHSLVETMHGFHVIFRTQAQRTQGGIQDAATLNRRLVRVLRGDENAVLLTQVLRVPGTRQFKDPRHPFLCRLLVDNGSTIAPYTLNAVRGVLDAWEVFHGAERAASRETGEPRQGSGWKEGLGGVAEGSRNATAASVVGGILGRLPAELWETAGWGGLKEWNGKNAPPLPERELRSVFESIARRERAGRQGGGRETGGERRGNIQVLISIRIERVGGGTVAASASRAGGASPVFPDPSRADTSGGTQAPAPADPAA
jgi:hypothetical protein